MESTHESSQTRKAAVGGLAVVGFIALILIGIATAIYAAAFLPKAFSRLSSANVYLSSVLQPGDGTLEMVNPTVPVDSTPAPTSVPLSPATPTTPVVVSTPAPTKPVAPAPVYTPPAYQPVIVPTTPARYGLPDLITDITSVGYLRYPGDASSFIAADTVPSGYQGAVRFVIGNHGTNVASSWYFEANLPASANSSYYRSAYQLSLNPGDSVMFTLGFDAVTRGNSTVRVTAAPDRSLNESNTSNNSDSANIYINSSSSNSGGGSYDSNGNYCSNGTYYSNGRYYCNSTSNNNNSGSYDSNGNYCRYGTYYANGRYYCDSETSSSSTNRYDSSGTYCTYGTYTQNGRRYCSGPYGNDSSSNGSYDSNGNYCRYGTYYSNGRYYCE